MTLRVFTVPEANALLPLLEASFRRIDRRRTEARRHLDALQVLDLVWGEGVHDPANPDHAEAATHRAAIDALLREIEEIVRLEITGRGVRFPQGGLDHGLVDFPTTWRGRWVLLCWRRGEPTVLAWHEVDAGFAGRRELTPEQAEGMGVEEPPDAEA